MKIMLAVDGSEGALDAVRHALRLVHSGLRASFVLANVQEPATLYEVVVAHDATVIEQVSEAAAAHALEPAAALLRAVGAVFETEVAHGDPAHALLDMAERFDCDLIILGARGIEALGEGGLGAVASSVLRTAGVPVLVVKRTAP